MVKNRQMPKQSANGANVSGKHFQTPLRYGEGAFGRSATSQIGGASVTTNISDKAKTIQALSVELKEVEELQLKVGEQMAVLLFEQTRLAEKCRALNRSMELMLNEAT